MGTPVKTVENQSKHLTNAEREARELAEQSVVPDRDREADLSKPPKGVSGAAATYWKQITARLIGCTLVDDLDRETLGIYCQMLARRDRLNRVLDKLMKLTIKADQAEDADSQGEKLLEATDKLDSLAGKVSRLERIILQYADKLGMTPQSRARLAQKRAAAAMETDSTEMELFGG